jgi:hypothetical protein
MTLAQDSHMNQPVTFDPNTSVGYFPWEDSTFGATRSYHLNSMSVASSNPFSQIMAPAVEGRSEMSVQSKTHKDDTTQQKSRVSDEEKEETGEVGAHESRAEGEEAEDPGMSKDQTKTMAVVLIGGMVVLGAAFWAITSA